MIKISANKKEIVVTDYFMKVLSKNKQAKEVIDSFSYSHRKEYVQRMTEAKTEPTGKKRMAEALAMIAEGNGRYWKYQKNKISS